MSDNSLLNVLTRQGVLISASIRYWRATKKLTAEDLGLNPNDVTETLISLGHKKLVSREALAQFALIESRAHAIVEASTFPFLNGLGRFLPNTKLAEATGKLQALEQEFAQAQLAFMRQYAELRVQASRDWWAAASKLVSDPDRLVATIEASFPRPDQMGRYFGFETHLFQISIPETMEAELVTMESQRQVMEARQTAVHAAAQQIAEGVDGFVRDCVASLREQTAQLCDDMLGSMRDGKTGVHQKTLNRLVNFIDQFKQLNFAGDRELEAQLEDIRRRFLTRTAEEYRDDNQARNRLQAGIRQLADTARDMARQDTREIIERFGQMGVRKFNLAA